MCSTACHFVAGGPYIDLAVTPVRILHTKYPAAILGVSLGNQSAIIT